MYTVSEDTKQLPTSGTVRNTFLKVWKICKIIVSSARSGHTEGGSGYTRGHPHKTRVRQWDGESRLYILRIKEMRVYCTVFTLTPIACLDPELCLGAKKTRSMRSLPLYPVVNFGIFTSNQIIDWLATCLIDCLYGGGLFESLSAHAFKASHYLPA